MISLRRYTMSVISRVCPQRISSGNTWTEGFIACQHSDRRKSRRASLAMHRTRARARMARRMRPRSRCIASSSWSLSGSTASLRCDTAWSWPYTRACSSTRLCEGALRALLVPRRALCCVARGGRRRSRRRPHVVALASGELQAVQAVHLHPGVALHAEQPAWS